MPKRTFPPAQPFTSLASKRPIGLCTQIVGGPGALPYFIDWAVFGASSTNNKIAIEINTLGNNTSGLAIDRIRSVHIDNTFSDVAVYAVFNDTGFTVVCPPNATVIHPVATNDSKAIVYAEGFITWRIPTTTVTFLNTHEAACYVPAIYNTPVVKTFREGRNDTSNASIYTFLNVNFGAPPSDGRRIAVLEVAAYATPGDTAFLGLDQANLGGPTQSLTLAGFSSSIGDADGTTVCGIFYGVIPTGTTRSVVIQPSRAASGCAIAAYTITDYDYTRPFSFDFAGADNLGNITRSINLDAPAGAAIFATSVTRTAGAPSNPMVIGGATVDYTAYEGSGAQNAGMAFASELSLWDGMKKLTTGATVISGITWL